MRQLHFFYTTTKLLSITMHAIGALYIFLSNLSKNYQYYPEKICNTDPLSK